MSGPLQFQQVLVKPRKTKTVHWRQRGGGLLSLVDTSGEIGLCTVQRGHYLSPKIIAFPEVTIYPQLATISTEIISVSACTARIGGLGGGVNFGNARI